MIIQVNLLWLVFVAVWFFAVLTVLAFLTGSNPKGEEIAFDESWNSVSDHLPKGSGKDWYLCFCEPLYNADRNSPGRQNVVIRQFDKKRGEFNGVPFWSAITHWMPLPAPPMPEEQSINA